MTTSFPRSGISFPTFDVDGAGTIYVAATHYGLNHVAVVIGTFIIGLTFRLLAIRYKWEMPKFIFNEDHR